MARRHDYDLIILGGGSVGIVSAVMAGSLKMRTLLIEKERMGGECLNTGCVPSKALLHAARVAWQMRRADQIGLPSRAISREEAAGALAYARRSIQTVEEAGQTTALIRQYGAEIRFGSAHFEDAHTLALDGQRLRAENFLLATGSHPAVPDIPGLEEAGYLTNRDIFALETIPESLLIMGGGPVGVEMAQAFQRLGSRVTLAQQGDRLLPRDDAELTRELTTILREEGVDIRLNAQIASVRREGSRRIAAIRQNGATTEWDGEAILVAVGRRPNVEGLNLETAGVRVENDRIPSDNALRSSARHVYVCGDLLGEYQFSHLAEYEAKIAVRNIVLPGASHPSFRIAPWTTFTDPELAHLGVTEEEAKAQGMAFEVYRWPFAKDDRALVENEGRGQVKILAQGLTGKIVGVQILGPRAGELIQEWVMAMQHGLNLHDVADLIHVYPTLSMTNQRAAQQWYQRKADDPRVEKVVETYARTIRPHQTAIALGLLGAGALGIGLGIARKGARKQP